MRPFAEGALTNRKVSAEQLLKWVLSDPRCTCAIPATRSEVHVLENARVGEPPWLDPDERDYVARVAS